MLRILMFNVNNTIEEKVVTIIILEQKNNHWKLPS